MASRRVYRANGRLALAVVNVPDDFALQAASLGVATNTFSPMAAGIHSPGATPRGFTGDRGYGVNRMGGRTLPLQNYGGATAPIADPRSRRLGAGFGAGGQPGLPSTGADAGGLGALAWLGYSQLGSPGMGSRG